MDLDRYLATHKPDWERLEALTHKGGKRAKRLSQSEVSEMVLLYQRTSANLSYIRTYHRDPSLIAHLTRVVSSAGSLIYGTRPRTWRMIGRFFAATFPAAVYRCRKFIAVSAVMTLLPAFIVAVWVANSPAALNSLGDKDARDAYVKHDFESYYASERASQFGSSVFTNNVQVSILAFAGGIAFCIPTTDVLIQNGANVGVAAGLFSSFGELPKFFGLIAPHGLLELTSVIISGGTGLQMGWALIAPGDRRRSRALVEEGRRMIVIVLGLVPAFGVAGTIEGFVTGQPWPTLLRVGIGVVVWVSFVVYLYVQGRYASEHGFTGAFGEEDNLGWSQAA